MEQCNKTALVRPSFMCQQHKRRLHHLSRRDVFVGKEIYTNPSFSFSLGGLIPPYIVKRLSGMGSSGLWEWWMKAIHKGSGLNSYTVNKALRKPTWDGNILVIFALLSFGIIVALLCLVIENRKRLYSQRLSGMGASGLWECWTKIMQEGSGLTNAVNKSLRKPTLDENILVIFVLLICDNNRSVKARKPDLYRLRVYKGAQNTPLEL
ncbi:unnamed protein product [Orchesella dallaii]|uniref:Uncharacterized protein n=1 Tax=Orchesella dallaii TaxID=48710 RepID=A0ABP1RTZ7_9HEXA